MPNSAGRQTLVVTNEQGQSWSMIRTEYGTHGFWIGGTRHREAEIETVLDHTADATEPTLRLGMTQVPTIPDCSTAFLA